MIRTHMEQLSQLSELLCAILQIFTSGAAQKVAKSAKFRHSEKKVEK